MLKMSNIAFIFDNLGPYHVARLSALSASCSLTAIEIRMRSLDYLWGGTETSAFRKITIGSDKAIELCNTLEEIAPDVVFVPGWSSAAALVALGWCLRAAVPAILMTDSQEIDLDRSLMKEWIKRRIVDQSAAAFVAGERHVQYAKKLGLSKEYIRTGYDVVDNQYFADGAALARENAEKLRNQLSLPQKYFLASARFVEKKNLFNLIDAYAAYHRCIPPERVWSLVLLGDGPLRGKVEAQIESHSLAEHIVLPGFKQYDALPSYYGLANAFVHASSVEQWGLVVNEAMASSLPVLVSDRCGCAPDLIAEGITGFTFTPVDKRQLADRLYRISTMSDADRSRMARASLQRIGEFGLNHFVRSALELVRLVEGRGRRKWLQGRVLLPALASIRD